MHGPLHVFGRTRTCNLLLRRQTPYPLGHEDIVRVLKGVP